MNALAGAIGLNLVTIIVAAVLMVGFVCLLFTPRAAGKWKTIPRPGPGLVTLANIGEGTHEEFISRLPDSALAHRFLLAKAGSDAKHADICGATDLPIGVWYDETGVTTDLTVPLSIGLLGAADETRKVAINSNVALGDPLVPDATGYAKTLPATAGVYNLIGYALKAGAAGDAIEFDPQPGKVIVAATYTVTNANNSVSALTSSSNTTQAEFNALRDKVENINDNLIALKVITDAAGITTT